MPGLAPVNSGLASQLGAIADTSITLRQKGEFEMRNGNLTRARQYLDEAARRYPVDPKVESVRAELDALFDKGTASLKVPRLQLSQQEFLKPTPPEKIEKYLGNPAVKRLRDAEVIAYNKLSNADAAFNRVSNPSDGSVNQKAVAEAQDKLNKAVEAFKLAQEKLKKKIYILEK